MTERTVVITGGNRGIGRSITEAFIAKGYYVVVGARNDPGLVDSYGDRVRFVSTDVRDPEAHIRLVDAAKERTGVLDVYVNNAGFSEWRPIANINEDFLTTLLDTNLKGAFWGCKAAAAVMQSGGAIVNISSLASKRGSSNNSAYCASKFGMNGLTQSLAKELGGRGIRVNALCPVLIWTEGLVEALLREDSPAKGDPDKFMSDFAAGNSALGRLPTGSEVGAMCTFLSSSDASAITGQCINVDCGVLPQ